jgi:MFS family permease
MVYGWVVVAAVMMVAVVSVAMAGPVIAFFIPVMHADLGIPMVYFGLAMSARQLGFALASPFLGRWIDRYGARPLLIGVGVFGGLLVYSLSWVSAGWHLVAIIGLLGFAGLQGAGGELYGSVVIAKWFTRNRGRAMAVAFIGTPLGIFFLTPLTQYWIETMGWPTVWKVYGVCGGALLVLAALFIRRPPTQRAETTPERPTQTSSDHNWTREQAMRSSAFWKIAVSFGILMFTISTVAMFRVQHFLDRGLDPQWVAIAFSVEAALSALVAFPIGMLIERFALHRLTAIGFCFAIIMLVLTINTHDLVMLFLATGAFGVGAASVMILQNSIWPGYFGSLHIGAIRGVAMPISLGFAIIGAPVAGLVRDATGSFVTLWWITALAMLIAIGLMLTVTPPDRAHARTTRLDRDA